MRLIRTLLGLLHRAEDAILATTLLSMILLAFSQIVMRNFFDASFVWADPMLRVMVLWVGMLGALAATRENRQISVDVLSRLLAGRLLHIARVITHAFAAAVCGVIAWHSARFVIDERTYGSTAFSNIPSWMLESIIPVAFALMTVRFALLMLTEVLNVIRGGEVPIPGTGIPTP